MVKRIIREPVLPVCEHCKADLTCIEASTDDSGRAWVKTCCICSRRVKQLRPPRESTGVKARAIYGGLRW